MRLRHTRNRVIRRAVTFALVVGISAGVLALQNGPVPGALGLPAGPVAGPCDPASGDCGGTEGEDGETEGESCGDGVCRATEDCASCALDCGACAPGCGDEICNGEETCGSCTDDCGSCPPVCGDGACNGTEACSNCPQDCGGCPAACGDGACNGSEGCTTCPGDCGTCPEVCGNGLCNGAETCVSCPGDCGICSPTCNDRVCNGTETCQTCAADCGACPAACGDASCSGAETCSTCAADCGNCPESCGNGTCGFGESCSSCPAECGACPPRCGDGSCNGTETSATCAADCGAPPALCDNGTCDKGETCSSCPGDCNACPALCGDGSCNGGESCSACAIDCGTCAAVCGDGVCMTKRERGSSTSSKKTLEESCASCSVDCGVCPPRCGDGMCLGGESCANCAGDCGKCVPVAHGTPVGEGTPIGVPLPSGEETLHLLRPDGTCDVWEDCANSPEDCGPCAGEASSPQPQPLLRTAQRLFRFPDVKRVVPRVGAFFTHFLHSFSDARAFRAVAQELLPFLDAAENRSLAERLTFLQRRWLRTVAEERPPKIYDRLMARSVARSLERGLEAEARETGKDLYELFSISAVRSLLWSWPGLNPLLRAAHDADLPAVLRFLPQPAQDLPALALKLREIGKVTGGTVLRPAPSAPAPREAADPGAMLRVSLALLRETKSIAAAPEKALPLLHDALDALKEDAEILAASAALPGDDVRRTLGAVRDGTRARSAPAWISALGALRSLATDEPRALREASYRAALGEMRTGFSLLRASVMQGESPRAEAAAILAMSVGGEAPAVLAGGDVALQRELLLALLAQELREGEALFRRMSDGERRMYDARIAEWRTASLHGAKTSADLRDALRLLRGIFVDAEATARAHSPFPLFFHRLQDILGIRS